MQWVPGAVSPRIKRQGGEADNFPPSTAELKNNADMYPLSHTSLGCGA
jgi:hypothetical protein